MDVGDWIQLGAYAATLIAGAATVRIELRYLRRDLDGFKQSVEKASLLVAETLTDHSERISRLEGRVGP
jgi:hypothetical protein